VTPRSVLAVVALAALLVSAEAHAGAPVPAAQPAGHWREASLEDYRAHLRALKTLVEVCAKARDMKTCDPALVGADDRVPLSETGDAERRLVRYGWLRVLLSQAQEKDTPDKNKSKPQATSIPGTNRLPRVQDVQPPPRTTTELLQDAETRVAHDLAQADAGAGPASAPAHNQERDAMTQVLSSREFRNLEAPSASDSMLEKFGNWLNALFEAAALFGSRSAWIGRALVGGFILAICVGLVWGLLQLERRWRIRLIPEQSDPVAGSASARDWQLWLEDARQAAEAGLWREAIHFVYWASISRLESRRLWPADRARTPREYLALVAPEDPRKAGLATLTSSFERIWYGGRAAEESDYRKAEQLANALISRSGIPASAASEVR
jgi:hypothetical protein